MAIYPWKISAISLWIISGFTQFLFSLEIPKNLNASLLIPENELYLLNDKEEILTYADVLENPNFNPIIKIKGGWFRDDVNIFWIRMNINDKTDKQIYLREDFTTSIWDKMELYTQCNGKTHRSVSGVTIPFSKRDIKTGDNILPLPDCKGIPYTIYLRLQRNVDPVYKITLSIDTYESFSAEYLPMNSFHAFFLGIIFVMTFYNFFVFIWLRDKAFLYYIIGNIFNGLLWISLTGFSTEHFWPESPLISKYLGNYIGFLSLVFAVLFVRSYLRLDQRSKRLDSYFKFYQWVFLSHLVLPLMISWITVSTLVSITTIFFGLSIIAVSFKLILEGYKPAFFLILGWSVLTSAMMIYASGLLGLIPMNFYTYYSIEMGSVIETTLFSFGLGYRYHILDKETKSLALKNENIEHELEMARKIQLSLLPRNISGRISVLYEPMRSVGGDFYEVIELGQEGKSGLLISDVCGHGIPAALITVFLKNILSDEIKLLAGKSENCSLTNPARLLRRLNTELVHSLQGGYITAIYGIIDFNNYIFQANGSAHPPPMILKTSGNGERILEFVNLSPQLPPIGMFEHSKVDINTLNSAEVTLTKNSYLILYSDGLMDAIEYSYKGKEKGLESFAHTPLYNLLKSIPFQQPHLFSSRLKETLNGNKEHGKYDDDICVVIVSL